MHVRWARHTAVAIVVAAMVVARSAPAGAIDAATTSSEADPRTFATIVVNGEERSEQLVFVKPDGVYVSLAGLRAAGLVIPPRIIERGVDRYVNVRDLSPEISARFDVDGPTLRLDAASAGSLWRTSAISLAPGEHRSREALATRSGYLNYGLRAGSAGFSGAQELTLSDGGKTFFSAGSLDAHGFHRSLTNLTWTSAFKRRRSMIGDVFGDSGNLGSTLTIAGVSIARASDIDPSDQPHISPTLHGTVLTPSTADVYINGQLIRTVEIPPGAVDFSNLPGLSGVTDAQIILRDSFGRTQTLTTRYYGAASVLSRGATDYSFAAGESREPLVVAQSSGKLVALGHYRIGVTESTTTGAHAEFARGFENLGATLDHAGKFGIWGAAIAQSRAGGAAGLAGSIAYTAGTRNVWIDAAIHRATPGYVSLSDRSFPDRMLRDERLSLGLRPFRGPYTSAISYSANRSLLGTAYQRLSWQHSIALQGGFSLLLTTGLTRNFNGSHPDFSFFVFRSASQSASTPAIDASFQSDSSGSRQAIELQHAVPPSGGSGYDITGYASGPTISSGRYALYAPLGDLDVDYNVGRAGPLSGNIAASGAIAFAGSYVHASRPISDSFTIVKVAGGERVKVLLDNQNIGVTDRNGILVVPNIRSYDSQRVSIERDDGPINLHLSNTDQRLVMASRHGSVALFSASVVTAIIGNVIVSGNGREVIPAFGQLSLRSGGKSITSELDREGHFYLEDVAPGEAAAVIRYGGGECRFTMEIPHRIGIEQNIGAFTCVRS